jgi:hypothetical protein
MLTVDLPEHAPHLLHIVKVKEERLGISVILLERDSEPVERSKLKECESCADVGE